MRNYNINIHIGSYKSITATYDDIVDSIDIDLYLTENDNIDEMLKKENLIKYIKLSIAETDEDELYTSKEALDIIEKSKAITINETSISMDFCEGIGNFIRNNPTLKNEEIFLNEEFEINHKDLECLLKELDGFNNIKIKLNGNDDCVSIEDYKKTVNAIEVISERIKKYNLSPLEQMMFAYDLVRDRVYTAESGSESKTQSRDLTSVLFGDKIVCVGYANIYEKVLDSLGIKNMMYSIKNVNPKMPGHRRNIVYVKDDKYNFEGVYYFDPTWDSKKSENDNSYLNSYRFFCCAKDDIDRYTTGKFVDRTFEGYSESSCWEFEEIVEDDGIKKVPRKMISMFNEVSRFIDDKDVINPLVAIDNPAIPEYISQSFNLETTMEDLTRYNGLFFYDELKANQLLEIMFNVRKIEYIEEPEKYPFNIESFKEALVSADKTQIRLHNSRYKTLSEDEFELESQNSDLPRKIEQVKLVKVLQRTLAKKSR